jgi:hypothetical protein
MADIETVSVESGDSYAIINKSDFDEKVHKLYKPGKKKAEKKSDADTARADKVDRLKAAFSDHVDTLSDDELNEALDRVSQSGGARNDLTRNPSGTFSTPTPTDIRYPDKDKTEFENNHGAFVGKSAAEIRQDEGLPDAPGGLDPDPKLAAQVEDQKKAEEADAKERAKEAAKAAKSSK